MREEYLGWARRDASLILFSCAPSLSLAGADWGQPLAYERSLELQGLAGVSLGGGSGLLGLLGVVSAVIRAVFDLAALHDLVADFKLIEVPADCDLRARRPAFGVWELVLLRAALRRARRKLRLAVRGRPVVKLRAALALLEDEFDAAHLLLGVLVLVVVLEGEYQVVVVAQLARAQGGAPVVLLDLLELDVAERDRLLALRLVLLALLRLQPVDVRALEQRVPLLPRLEELVQRPHVEVLPAKRTVLVLEGPVVDAILVENVEARRQLYLLLLPEVHQAHLSESEEEGRLLAR